MLRDFKYALRQLRKSPGFTVTAVLTLALGIGANTAIFALIDSIMLRPLPFPHQEQLARIMGQTGQIFPKGWIRELGNHSESFSALSGYGLDAESNVAEADSSDRVFGAAVMANAFDALGLHPSLGRFFLPEDAVTGQDQKVVLSYGYWQQHFGGDASVIGKRLRIDGVWREIVGVMPAGIRFPYSDTQFVTPIAFKGGDPIDAWNDFSLRAFGRLKGGTTTTQAQTELRRLRPLLVSTFPWRMPDAWASDMTVVPLLEAQVGDMRPRLLLLFGAVGLVLLIACANVANLVLARAAVREREMAVRGALGASAGRLVRQILSESLLLGILAGFVGLIAAATSLQAFVRILPADTPRLGDISLRGTVFLFAAGASVLTGILFGLIPALRMAKPNLQEALHSGSRSVAGKASQFRLSMALVLGQIGLTVVVITAAGLMLHSLYSLSKVDPGFRTDRIVTAEVSLDSTACKEKGRCQAFFEALAQRAQGVAGAENVALADSLPLSGRDQNYNFDAENYPRDARQRAQMATARTVSPGYFSTLDLHLVRGRLLTEQDASGVSRAAVINERLASRLWPNQDPLGKHIINVVDEKTPAIWEPDSAAVVVGVVTNTHEDGLGTEYGDEVYLPLTATHEQPMMYVLLRTQASATEAAAGLRQVVAQVDSLVPVTRVRTLNEVVSASVSTPRSLTILLLGFGLLAVVIGGVGVYSLIAYVVSWRTREIGVRLALGASRTQIVSGVVKQSLALAIGGSLVGLVAAGLLTRFLHSFLFQVSALDPWTFCAVPMLMTLIALAAAWIPARRAASVDPMVALRSE